MATTACYSPSPPTCAYARSPPAKLSTQITRKLCRQQACCDSGRHWISHYDTSLAGPVKARACITGITARHFEGEGDMSEGAGGGSSNLRTAGPSSSTSGVRSDWARCQALGRSCGRHPPSASALSSAAARAGDSAQGADAAGVGPAPGRGPGPAIRGAGPMFRGTGLAVGGTAGRPGAAHLTVGAKSAGRRTAESEAGGDGVSWTPPPLPERRTVVGFGGVGMDYLASVASFPEPDAKIRTTDLLVQGGGNVGNALTAASRLGLRARVVSKVADDTLGRQILEELEEDGVDTSHMVIGEGGISPFTYVIVDRQTKTRTCIHTAGAPPLTPSELPPSAISAILEGAHLLYLDCRLPASALAIAEEATCQGLPILVDAERPREGLDDLIQHATAIVASENFATTWTRLSTLGDAMLEVLRRLPRARFVITTLGSKGCAMIERWAEDVAATSVREGEEVVKEVEVASVLSQLADQALDVGAEREGGRPCVVESQVGRLISSQDAASPIDHGGTVWGRALFCPSLPLTEEEVVDTTGAGDAFVGAVLYGLLVGLPAERILPLAATVAGAKCKALGARTGLPLRQDPVLEAVL